MSLQVWIPGIPKGQPRPRACVRAGWARVYDPGTAEGWKRTVTAAMHPYRSTHLTGPLFVELDFVLPQPRSHHGRGRNGGQLKRSAPLRHSSRPDIDNLTKAVLDVLTDIGLWADDGRIWALEARKVYGTDPGFEIRIEDLGEPPGAAPSPTSRCFSRTDARSSSRPRAATSGRTAYSSSRSPGAGSRSAPGHSGSGGRRRG